MVKIFDTAQDRSMEQEIKPINGRQCTSPPTRWGMPRDLDHDYDRQFLFLPTLHKTLNDDQTVVTSLFVQRSIYFAFFGKELAVDLEHHSLRRRANPELWYANITEPDEQEAKKAQLRQLSQEEQQKKQIIEGLAAEIRDKGEKLASLAAQITECESVLQPIARERVEQVEMGHLIAELEARLAKLAAKEKDQVEKLEALTSMEQVQRQGLGQLGELMQEQEDRLNEMALEEQKQKSRLDRYRLVERERLEREKLARVAGEIYESPAGGEGGYRSR